MIYDLPITSANLFNILVKVGVFTSKLAFQPPWVNAGNGYQILPKTLEFMNKGRICLR